MGMVGGLSISMDLSIGVGRAAVAITASALKTAIAVGMVGPAAVAAARQAGHLHVGRVVHITGVVVVGGMPLWTFKQRQPYISQTPRPHRT